MHDDSIARHRAQPVDPTWAPAAAQSIRQELAELEARQAFSVFEVDCRSDSCIATMEWPTYRDAAATYAELVHHYYEEVNCLRRLILPEPEDKDAPFQATLVFDCAADDGSQ
jgi:hypothetical protein